MCLRDFGLARSLRVHELARSLWKACARVTPFKFWKNKFHRILKSIAESFERGSTVAWWFVQLDDMWFWGVSDSCLWPFGIRFKVVTGQNDAAFTCTPFESPVIAVLLGFNRWAAKNSAVHYVKSNWSILTLPITAAIAHIQTPTRIWKGTPCKQRSRQRKKMFAILSSWCAKGYWGTFNIFWLFSINMPSTTLVKFRPNSKANHF